MRELAQFIMRGRFYAAGMAGIFGGLSLLFPPLAYLSGAAVGLITLRVGIKDGVFVTVGAALVAGVIAILFARTPIPGLLLVLILWLPMLIGASVLRTSQSQGLALLVIGTIVAMYVITMHLATGDVTAWWTENLKQAIEGRQIEGISVEEITKQGSFQFINGVMAGFLALNLTLTLFLARWWQSLLYNPGGFRSEFHQLQLPRALAAVVILMFVLVFTGEKQASIWRDLLFIAVAIYFIHGLAVMHGLIGLRGKSGWWLSPIYVGLFFLPPHVVLGLVLVGLVDSLVHFRSRGVPSP